MFKSRPIPWRIIHYFNIQRTSHERQSATALWPNITAKKKKSSVWHRHLTWWNEIRWNLFLSEGKLQACWWLASHTDSSLGSPPPVPRQHRGSRAWTDMNREWPHTPPLQTPSAGCSGFKGQTSLRSHKHIICLLPRIQRWETGRLLKQEN